jgi:CubicO group peptidase (beta-lactamase class C family)
VAIGVISHKHSISASAASGLIDRKAEISAKNDDMFVWGSVTKVLTGMTVLRLVEQGAFSLDASITPLIDPFLAKMKKADPSLKFGSLEDLFGQDVKKVSCLADTYAAYM